MKPIKTFKKLKSITKPIYQYHKKEKEFVRVYYIQSIENGEIKLGFNDFFIFAGNDCQFDFNRISYRYIDARTFKSDNNKFVMYY